MRRQALLSVHDKTGLAEFGAALVALDFELIASGGTAWALAGAGLAVRAVEEITGFPEVLGGRVKTLHPAIHAGILARRTPEHLAEIDALGIAPIDLVACNLYPFAETAQRSGVSEREVVEEIDIGGVTLLRAAAKNFASVVVVCDPGDYAQVSEAVRIGSLTEAVRRRLALKAFQHTADYDATIASWFSGQSEPTEPLPKRLCLTADRAQTLRYGENPHQVAALYRWVGSEPVYRQVQGKELSYNNLVDLDAAWAMPGEYRDPAVAIVKHTNPCGLASAPTLVEAYQLALASDPISAYGSIVAANREIDLELVTEIGDLFLEVLIAPAFTPDALGWLAKHKPNCRVIVGRPIPPGEFQLRSLGGGFVAQTPDLRGADDTQWQVVTRRCPSPAELCGLKFAWLAVKHVKSNAIVLAQDTAIVGVGAGQMNRVDSVYLAVRRAGARAHGSVMASDAFFPFADGIEAAGAAGITACVQPGGSLRDAAAIAAADRLGMAMVFTGERHFRH